jgi:hypothetical protein
MSKRAATVLALMLFSLPAWAAEPVVPTAVERQGPLVGLPSKPGPHIEKIKALGDNEWLNLGSPAPDPKWGKALGRSFSYKMPYAPDLQGAFLFGLGVHGFVKANGYYGDDLYFYDLNAHRWIALYPGTNSKDFVEKVKTGEFKVNDDGQLINKDGDLVPFAGMGYHGFQGHTYDTHLKKHVYFSATGGIGGDQHTAQIKPFADGTELLQKQIKGKTDRVTGTPFFFNTLTGKYERYAMDGSKPYTVHGSLLEYLPSKKELFYYYLGKTSCYDIAAHKWSNAGAKGPAPKGVDFGACYDSKRERIYVAGGGYRDPWGKDEGYVYIYDVKTNSWSNLPNKGKAPVYYDSNNACMNYDSANDRVICIVHLGGNLREASKVKGGLCVYVYDPNTAAWSEDLLPLPAKLPALCWNGFYSPEVNAHIIYMAGDSQDNGTMWAYRYKKVNGPPNNR